MITPEEKKNRLILIGKAAEYFDESFYPRRDIQELKFVMLKDSESSELKMLLMEARNPYDYHPQAVHRYMQDNSLESIITNGGGKICFDLHEMTCTFFGISTSFENVCPAEVIVFIKAMWPTLTAGCHDIPVYAKEIALSGKTHTCKEVSDMF
jgi:hypothetical protein